MIKKILRFAGLGILVLLITAVLMQRGIFMGIQNGLQNKFYDYDQASKDIVVVAIDETSLKGDALGPLSDWSRGNYAGVIEQLNEAGAAVIGLDITLPDSKEGDETLAKTLSEYDNVVLAGRYYFENGKRKTELPNDTLMSAVPAVGWINVKQDEDGFVRQLPLFADDLSAFSLAVARKVKNVDSTAIPVVTLRDDQEIAELMHINYFGAPNTFRQISFADALNGDFVSKRGDKVDLRGKIVLIGPTAIDLQDHYLAPNSEGIKMAGVEIHANAVQTFLEDAYLRDQSQLSLWITLLSLLVINLILFALLKVRYAVPVAAMEILGILVAGVTAYEFRVFLNVVYPIFLVILSFIGIFLLRFILEQRQRRFIQGAFGHYVNKTVVDQILKHPEMLELGGAKRTITTFFSDIAGFTAISEKMKPDELVTFLNEYLQAMTEIILKHNGTLDKYEGDAVMAFWNAPLAQHDHALSACHAALEQQAKLTDMRKRWSKEGHDEIYIRIGLNTGEAVVGNMGSSDRFDYTAIGDSVNLASRLEGINKQYGTRIIAARSTYLETKDDFVWRELDLIRVKGKNEPVRIYELVGEAGRVKSKTAQDLELFKEALARYYDRHFEEAEKKFASIQNDPAAQVFAKRCDEFLKNPPAEDWDGVFTFTDK